MGATGAFGFFTTRSLCRVFRLASNFSCLALTDSLICNLSPYVMGFYPAGANPLTCLSLPCTSLGFLPLPLLPSPTLNTFLAFLDLFRADFGLAAPGVTFLLFALLRPICKYAYKETLFNCLEITTLLYLLYQTHFTLVATSSSSSA